MVIDTDASPTDHQPGLRRNLRLWQVIGLSVGLMAPSMAISINPQGAIGAVGRAIPLSFLISMVGALLVAYGFSRLSQHFHNSGSVLGLVGATLGARAGVVAGWCLAGCYVIFALLTAVTAGIYGTIFLNNVGITSSQPNWLEYVIATVVVFAAGAMAAVPAAKATDVILSFEGVTMILILIAAAIVLIKLVGHSGPGHLHFTMSVFAPAKGTSISNVFLGVVFGFLSFAGFEGAAALGGEAAKPRRDIPRAIVATVVVIGVFYVAVSAIEVMGFGTSKAGLSTFAASPALLGTLGRTYVANWFGDLIIAGTIVSAFGCCMASTVGASRLIFSFARDGVSPRHPVARLSARYGTPVAAVGVVIAIELAIEIAVTIPDVPALTVFAWTGFIGTILILLAYGLVTIGAGSYLFLRPLLQGEPTKARIGEAVFPVLGIVLLGYTIYRNVIPLPTGTQVWKVIIPAVWLAVAVGFVTLSPASSRRLGDRLITDEGMEALPPAQGVGPLVGQGATG